jgi:hypothetical protein
LHQPPWSIGFDSQTREPRETRAPPCVEIPGSSRIPANSFIKGTAVINTHTHHINKPNLHLSRLRLFQRHLRSLVWVRNQGLGLASLAHFSPRTRSPSSRHPPFTHNPFSPRSLVCGGQTSPQKPRLVVSASHSTCSPLYSSPHASSFELGTAVTNNDNKPLPHTKRTALY